MQLPTIVAVAAVLLILAETAGLITAIVSARRSATRLARHWGRIGPPKRGGQRRFWRRPRADRPGVAEQARRDLVGGA